MKGKSYITENRELAFRRYVENGGNAEATLRDLEKKDGLKLSKPTFYEWMKKYNFEERLAKIDSDKQTAKDLDATFEESMFKALSKQKITYENYFETLTTPDHQAQYAYAGIIKAMMDIRTRMASFKAALFLDFMKDLITFLGKNDPAVIPAIEENFDDFIAYAKEKYGA